MPVIRLAVLLLFVAGCPDSSDTNDFDCDAGCPESCPAPDYWICASDGQEYCDECTIVCAGLEVAEDSASCE